MGSTQKCERCEQFCGVKASPLVSKTSARHGCKKLFVLFAVFGRGEAGVFFEDAGKVALRGEAEIIAYGGERFVGEGEETFCLVGFFRENEICERHAGFLFEFG